MSLHLLIFCAFAGVLCGYPLARFAAYRSSRQPVDFDLEAERTVLRWILDTPGNLVRVAQLDREHFSYRPHGALFAELRAAAGDLPVLDDNADEATINAAVQSVQVDLQDIARTHNPDLLALILSSPSVGNSPSGLDAAQRVFFSGDDRLRYPGASPIEQVDNSDRPLRRVIRLPRPPRIALSAALAAAATFAAISIAGAVWPVGIAHTLALASLAVLAAGSIIWALVDLDTLLIDLETFIPLTIISWVLAISAGFAGGEPSRALRGFGLSVLLAVLFRVLNAGYALYKLRTTGVRVDGMGGGDSWLVLATAGVPAALAGSLSMWYLCAMAGMVAAVVVWLVRWPTPWRIGRTTPFAFGPYLALGWILGGSLAAAGLNFW